MKQHRWLSTGMTALFVLAGACAFGQTADPAETDPTVAPTEESTEASTPEAPVRRREITIGIDSIKFNDALRRYGRPPQGLTLHRLRFSSPYGEGPAYGKLLVTGMPERDNAIEGMITFNHGHTTIKARRTESGSYVMDWRAKPMSNRKQVEYTVDQVLTQSLGMFLSYRSFEQSTGYPAPRATDHTRNEVVAAGVVGQVLGGQFDATLASRRTRDVNGALPTTMQRRADATYSRDFGSHLNLEGTVGFSRIEQAGLPASNVKNVGFAGVLDLGPSTGLQFNLGRTDYDFNTNQTPSIRKRTISGLRLVHISNKWSFQFGYRHRETERIRGDRTFVDVPKLNDYDARLSGRIGTARVTLKGSWEDLRTSAIMTTLDKRQMLWDDRATFQAKVDGGNETFLAYGVYTYRFQQNKQRGVDIKWNNLVLGGSYVFNPWVQAYAEVSNDSFSARSEGSTALDFFFPNSRTAALGLSWTKSPGLSGSASLNLYESGDIRGSQLTLTLRKQLSADHDFEFMVAPWRQTDRLYGISGYRTTMLSARYTVKF
ncbi:MAG: hypothetical protein JNM85_02560 [Chthonomonas sp.]|nr:hypothetical protein [Chthonomonas sp.]